MVLLSSWSPSRKNEGVAVIASKRQNFPVITILVLSLSVWTTLQCVTSLPQHEIRPMIFTPTEEQTVKEKRSENSEASADFPAWDNTGISKQGWCLKERQFVKLCGSKLWEAIVTCCGSNNIYEPTTNNGNSLGAEQSSSTKAYDNFLIAGCCQKPCSAGTFKSFCNDPNKIPMMEASSSEQVADNNETAGSQQEEPLDPEPRVQPTSPPDNSERFIHKYVLDLLNFFRPKSGKRNPLKEQVTAAEEKRDSRTGPIVQEGETPLSQARISPAFTGEFPSYGQTGKQRHVDNPCTPREAEVVARRSRGPSEGQEEQRARKVSTSNVLTSTIAPDARVFRLESSTDDEALYKKKK